MPALYESPLDMPLETAKALYRRAIEPNASYGEGDAWWAAVAAEVVAVAGAENTAAAAIIAWWHHDWSQVEAAAARLRRASRALSRRVSK
ncbi:hypothetical protein KB879_37245 (plasmid) [Cupriavidus sp. KK10]|jgi:DNA/RNA-binding domain of Phe-tRNA-synthetase-like protein|nr:hypothetical protein KB879_37245 [Cupriavidus sp. KK10]